MTVDELVQHLSAERFVSDFSAASKEEALEKLTEAVVAGSNMSDHATILQMLRNREQLGSTALSQGVAFPHGRSLAVTKLTLLVARSKAGVDFESEDGKSTHLFFVILAPPQDTGNYYLQALGKIAELVRKSEVCNGLMEAEDFDALATVLKEAG